MEVEFKEEFQGLYQDESPSRGTLKVALKLRHWIETF